MRNFCEAKTNRLLVVKTFCPKCKKNLILPPIRRNMPLNTVRAGRPTLNLEGFLDRKVIVTLLLISLFLLSSFVAVPIIRQLVSGDTPQIVSLTVLDQSGTPLVGAEVQGFMETASQNGASGLTEVFNGTTGAGGLFLTEDLNQAEQIAQNWIAYQGVSAQYFSPRILLMITYVNSTGDVFVEEDSVNLTQVQLAAGDSAIMSFDMDLLAKPAAYINFTTFDQSRELAPARSQSSAFFSIPILGDVFRSIYSAISSAFRTAEATSFPNPPNSCPSTVSGSDTSCSWILQSTYGPYPSSCCGPVPIGWASVTGGAYAVLNGYLYASSTDNINTGYVVGQTSNFDNPSYYSGSRIATLQNGVSFTSDTCLNACGSNPPSSAVNLRQY